MADDLLPDRGSMPMVDRSDSRPRSVIGLAFRSVRSIWGVFAVRKQESLNQHRRRGFSAVRSDSVSGSRAGPRVYDPHVELISSGCGDRVSGHESSRLEMAYSKGEMAVLDQRGVRPDAAVRIGPSIQRRERRAVQQDEPTVGSAIGSGSVCWESGDDGCYRILPDSPKLDWDFRGSPLDWCSRVFQALYPALNSRVGLSGLFGFYWISDSAGHVESKRLTTHRDMEARHQGSAVVSILRVWKHDWELHRCWDKFVDVFRSGRRVLCAWGFGIGGLFRDRSVGHQESCFTSQGVGASVSMGVPVSEPAGFSKNDPHWLLPYRGSGDQKQGDRT